MSGDDDGLMLLKLSLADAQATVRAYDTKAQIVGVGYLFSLGVVGRIGDMIPENGEIVPISIVLAWVVGVLPVVLFGAVLYPSRKMAPLIEAERQTPVEHVLYVDPQNIKSVEELTKCARQADAEKEIAYELLKVSLLRELKRKRFLRALFAAGMSFLFLFSTHSLLSAGFLS